MKNRLFRLLGITAFAGVVLVSAVSAQSDEQVFTGTINSGTPDTYEISLTAGQAVLITAEATSGDLDTYLRLLDPNRAIVGENDDRRLGVITDSALGVVAEITGTYTIEMTRYPEAPSSGNYELVVRTGDPSILSALNELMTRIEFTGPAEFIDTQHFRIHYTTSGADAVTAEYLDEVAKAAEEFYNIQVNQLGFAAPPSDEQMGGNSLIDVYVTDLLGEEEGGALGYVSPETVIGDNPNTQQTETGATATYMVIDNDYDPSQADTSNSADSIALMRTTFTHELNHVLQFGYDGNDSHGWFFEATASWIETITAGEDEDATGYVAYNYTYPEICFGTLTDPEAGSLQYGDWTFMQMLADQFGTDSVRQYWEFIAQFDGWGSLEQFSAARGLTVPDLVEAYRLKNLARDYALAPSFNATVYLENTIADVGLWTFSGLGIQELGANYFRLDLPPGQYNAALVGAGSGLEIWAAGVIGTEKVEAIRLSTGGTFDTTPYDETYLMVFNRSYNADADACSYANYDIEVSAGKSAPAPITYVFPATHFETLR
ncbi:MAG: PPC domain-containing protein [Pleurocapsa minor GSE-CHR-MK-17-07R]|nr:PPC domain-containing protein [Pleurocapsa minor GSE-CHR-MK 17-07R]